MPKVSIILPCYNVEKYLEKSIKSILNQTYKDFELLIIIDGSLDNSQSIAEKYAEKDCRIQVFTKENGGVSDARNYGLERVKGDFVYFMDSDDWIEPNLLEDNLSILETQDLDFIIFGYIQDNEDIKGNISSSNDVMPTHNRINKKIDSLTLNYINLGLLGYAWNKIYRKSFLDKYELKFQKGLSLIEDIIFNIPIYKVSETINFNKKLYYHYINRDVSSLIKQFYSNSYELMKRRTEIIKYFLIDWNIQNKNEILAFYHLQGIRYCVNNLFSYKNELSIFNKYKYIKMMIFDPETKRLINYLQPTVKGDSLYKFCIKNNLVTPILIFALTK